jgi:hypothetical protein
MRILRTVILGTGTGRANGNLQSAKSSGGWIAMGGVKGGMMELPLVFQAFMWMVVLLLGLLFLGMAGWLIGQFIEWLGYQYWLHDLFKGE